MPPELARHYIALPADGAEMTRRAAYDRRLRAHGPNERHDRRGIVQPQTTRPPPRDRPDRGRAAARAALHMPVDVRSLALIVLTVLASHLRAALGQGDPRADPARRDVQLRADAGRRHACSAGACRAPLGAGARADARSSPVIGWGRLEAVATTRRRSIETLPQVAQKLRQRRREARRASRPARRSRKCSRRPTSSSRRPSRPPPRRRRVGRAGRVGGAAPAAPARHDDDHDRRPDHADAARRRRRRGVTRVVVERPPSTSATTSGAGRSACSPSSARRSSSCSSRCSCSPRATPSGARWSSSPGRA